MPSKNLCDYRLEYRPKLPDALDDDELLMGYGQEKVFSPDSIQKLFPKTHSQPIIHFQKGYPPKHNPLKVGVVFSVDKHPEGIMS